MAGMAIPSNLSVPSINETAQLYEDALDSVGLKMGPLVTLVAAVAIFAMMFSGSRWRNLTWFAMFILFGVVIPSLLVLTVIDIIFYGSIGASTGLSVAALVITLTSFLFMFTRSLLIFLKTRTLKAWSFGVTGIVVCPVGDKIRYFLGTVGSVGYPLIVGVPSGKASFATSNGVFKFDCPTLSDTPDSMLCVTPVKTFLCKRSEQAIGDSSNSDRTAGMLIYTPEKVLNRADSDAWFKKHSGKNSGSDAESVKID